MGVLVAPRLVANLAIDLVAQLLADDAFVDDVIAQRHFPLQLRLVATDCAAPRPAGETQYQFENCQRIGHVRIRVFRQQRCLNRLFLGAPQVRLEISISKLFVKKRIDFREMKNLKVNAGEFGERVVVQIGRQLAFAIR